MTVRGHYNGSVVVLDEPAPVDHEVEVEVRFPTGTSEEAELDRFGWYKTRHLTSGRSVDSRDIIRMMRDMD